MRAVSELHHIVPMQNERSKQWNRIAYKMANLRGLIARTGKSAKQMTKHARAPRLHPLKIKIRSHLLTIVQLAMILNTKGFVSVRNTRAIIVTRRREC